MDLKQVVDLAGIAFAGTVTSKQSEWLPSHTSIITKVRFGDVVLAKGTLKGNEITLSLRGGHVGKDWIVVSGMPDFEVGKRYVILSYADLGSGESAFLPIVGLYQGFYPVTPDGPSGPAVVHTWDGLPVVGQEADHLVVVDNQSSASEEQSVRRAEVYSDPSRRPPSAGDSVPDTTTRSQGTHRQPVLPDEVSAPSRPQTQPARAPTVPTSGWIEPSKTPIRIIAPRDDNGKRLSENEFLSIIGRLGTKAR